MLDARTGTLGVTFPSIRRSSESEEASSPQYEYICTNLVSCYTRHLNEIAVTTLNSHEVSIEINQSLRIDQLLVQSTILIDPKAILRARYPSVFPDSCLSHERVRGLAEIALQLSLN